MSRSGYSKDCDDQWGWIKWRGIVASSIRGKRGQRLLTELLEAMETMPDKVLIPHDLKNDDGYCALGVVGAKRGINLDELDPEDHESIACAFDIAEPLAQEIVYLNDEHCDLSSPEERWKYMHAWVLSKIKKHKESQ